MFVEEGFRIRFANGEVIDFYADSSSDKAAWMEVLSEVIGKDALSNQKAWTEIVLQKERQDRRAGVLPPRPASEGNDQATLAASFQPRHTAHKSMDATTMMRPPQNIHSTKSVPSSPVKTQPASRPSMNASPTKPHHDRTRSQVQSAAAARIEERRKKVRSMIF